MQRKEKLAEGSRKVLYSASTIDELILYYKDPVTGSSGITANGASRTRQKLNDAKTAAENDAKDSAEISTKAGTKIVAKADSLLLNSSGVLNCAVSAKIFSHLSLLAVPNHFISRVNMREHLVTRAEVLPIKFRIRNRADLNFSDRFDYQAYKSLPRPITELYIKTKRGYQIAADEHAVALDMASGSELEEINAIAIRVNDFLSGLFYGFGVELIDVELRFGRVWCLELPILLLVDEISLDKCSLRHVDSGVITSVDQINKPNAKQKRFVERLSKELDQKLQLDHNQRDGHGFSDSHHLVEQTKF